VIMLTLEKEIERKFCEVIKDKGGFVVKFTDPARRGAPDRLVLIFGVCFFVEFKTPRGKLAKHQIEYAKKLNEQEIKVFLIDSHEKSDRFLSALGTGPIDPICFLLNTVE